MLYTALADRAVLSVTGTDARTFLQDLVTADLAAVDAEGARWSALLSPQGKVLFDFILVATGEGYLIDLPSPLAPDVLRRLGLYKLRAKVEIRDASAVTNVLAMWDTPAAPPPGVVPDRSAEDAEGKGTRSPAQDAPGAPSPARAAPAPAGDDTGEALRASLGAPTGPSPANDEITRMAAALGPGACIIADPRLPALGYRAYVPRERPSSHVAPALTPADPAAYDSHRLALGIPAGGIDFRYGDAFPHDVGMDQLGAVGFAKGCYVGQEVVSRMQHRGTARNRPVLVAGDADLPPTGTPLTVGERPLGTLGTVIGARGLAVVRLDRAREAMAAGTPILAAGVPVRLALPPWAQYSWPESGSGAADG